MSFFSFLIVVRCLHMSDEITKNENKKKKKKRQVLQKWAEMCWLSQAAPEKDIDKSNYVCVCLNNTARIFGFEK